MVCRLTSDNEYYVNSLRNPGSFPKKTARPPAEWGPGLREETDCFPQRKLVYRRPPPPWLPPLELVWPPPLPLEAGWLLPLGAGAERGAL